MSDSTPDLSRIEIFVLARLSGQKEPPSESDIVETLFNLGIPAASKGEWRTRLAITLATLRSRSLVDKRRALTPEGRRVLADAFGLSRAPTWKQAQEKHMPALALGLEAGSDAVAGKRLQATLLAAFLELERRPTPAQVLEALFCSELGLPPGKVTLNKIRDHLIARRTGIEVKGKTDEVARRLATRFVDAPNGKGLRPALVKRWLAGEPLAAAARPAGSPAAKGSSPSPTRRPTAGGSAATSAAAARPLDDGSFAVMVTDAAREVGPDGRFGPHKVFISAIWRNLADDLHRRGMNIDDLKRRLVDANRAGLLSLARADLVGAMDPAEVKASEILDRGASFHFVVDGSRLS